MKNEYDETENWQRFADHQEDGYIPSSWMTRKRVKKPVLDGLTVAETEAFMKEWDETRKKILEYLNETGREVYLCAYTETGEKMGGKPDGIWNRQ